VRSDGTLLGLTYLPEHDVWGWHRHDTDGTYEDVCVIPEGSIDAVYVVVKRTINGVDEALHRALPVARLHGHRYDAILPTRISRTTGATRPRRRSRCRPAAGWTVDDTITVTAKRERSSSPEMSATTTSLRSATDIVRIRVVTFTSDVVVSGTPSMTVPASLRGVATATWSRCVDDLAGLDHLEGKEVSVLGDGNVVSSPYNDAILDDHCRGWRDLISVDRTRDPCRTAVRERLRDARPRCRRRADTRPRKTSRISA
jgi:hypothetical protein